MATSDPLHLTGTVVSEKYRVEALVGQGGFALVYRAVHIMWNRPVALKVFRVLGDLPDAQRAELMQSFLEEGRLLADLSERSAVFVQSRDVGTLTTEDGAWMPYMVLEWLEGQVLDHVMRDREKQRAAPMQLPEAIALLEPVANGLALAHSMGIAHRDVKPANIFIVRGGAGDSVVKLLDLGIAKVVQDAQAEAGAFGQTTGIASSFTPAYGAPEQFSRQHGATGPWTDVYSLALVLLELASGKRLWHGLHLASIALATCHPTERPNAHLYGLATPPLVDAVFGRAFELDADDRYQTVGEFWSELRQSLGLVTRLGSPTDAQPNSLNISGTPRLAEIVAARNSIPVPRLAHVAPPSKLVIPTAPPLPTAASLGLPPRPAPVSDMPGGVSHTEPTTVSGPKLKASSASAAEDLRTSAGAKKRRMVRTVGAVAAIGTVAILAAGAMMVRSSGMSRSRDALTTGAAGDGAPSATLGIAPAGNADAAIASPVATGGACPADMVPIPGGLFYMGADKLTPGVVPNELPSHQVSLRPYCIDRFEVTTEQYLACSSRGACKRVIPSNSFDELSSHDKPVFDQLCTVNSPEQLAHHPINCVDWERAEHFCTATGKRLPTEAEWEFAARGTDGRMYPWGDEAPSPTRLNACGSECVAWGKAHGITEKAMYDADDAFPNSAPVGSFPAGKSLYGVEDLVGNVWEWVADWYGPYEAGAAKALTENPRGPSAGSRRVIRGGGWNGAFASWVRPSFRYNDDPEHSSYGVGFRCAK